MKVNNFSQHYVLKRRKKRMRMMMIIVVIIMIKMDVLTGWWKTERVLLVRTYVLVKIHMCLFPSNILQFFLNIYAFIDIHMTTFIYLRIKQFYVYFCTSELIFCVWILYFAIPVYRSNKLFVWLHLKSKLIFDLYSYLFIQFYFFLYRSIWFKDNTKLYDINITNIWIKSK